MRSSARAVAVATRAMSSFPRLLPADRADRRHPRLPPQRAQARDEPRRRVIGAADEDVGGVDARLLELGIQLDRGADVAERGQDLLVEREGRDHEGPPAGRLQRAGLLVQKRLDLLHAVDVDHGHVRAHQVVEQQVALDPGPLDPVNQHQRDRKPVLARGRRDLPAPVGLRVGARDHRIGARLQDLGEGELQVARLVAAEGEAREVVPLDVERAHADRFREPGAGVERRRQMREPDARMRCEPGREVVPRHRSVPMRRCNRHVVPRPVSRPSYRRREAPGNRRRSPPILAGCTVPLPVY